MSRKTHLIDAALEKFFCFKNTSHWPNYINQFSTQLRLLLEYVLPFDELLHQTFVLSGLTSNRPIYLQLTVPIKETANIPIKSVKWCFRRQMFICIVGAEKGKKQRHPVHKLLIDSGIRFHCLASAAPPPCFRYKASYPRDDSVLPQKSFAEHTLH